MAWCNQRLVVHTIIGLLLGIGFIFPIFWWVSLFGVCWLSWILVVDNKVKSSYTLCLYVWWIKYLCALIWFWSAYPIDWLGVTFGFVELPIIAFYWMSGAFWLSLGGLLFYALVTKLKKYLPTPYLFFTIPIIWLIAELGGAWSFSLFTYGPGAQLTTSFSFGFVGYHLAQHGLLVSMAQWGGVYIMTLILAFIASIGLVLYQQKRWSIFTVGVIILVITGYMSPPLDQSVVSDPLTIAVVDTRFPNNVWTTRDGSAMKDTQSKAALAAAKILDPDYIIFPDGIKVLQQADNLAATRATLAFQHADTDAVIIDSGRTIVNTDSVLQSVLYDGSEQAVYTTKKRYLVPQGEFMPWLYSGLLWGLGYGDLAITLDQRLSYTVGQQASQAGFSSRIPAVLFCFESVSPLGVRSILQERSEPAPFVAHVVAHGWFNEPTVLWQQLESMLRVQAIWNNVYIVSAGNLVSGYVVTPTGAIVYPQPITHGQDWQVGLVKIPI